MYKCLECGMIFDEDEMGEVVTKHPCGEGYAEEALGVCPKCGRDSYEQVIQCLDCGEYFSIDELYGDYCDDCLGNHISYEEVKEYSQSYGIFSDFLNDMFNAEEKIAILEQALDEKYKELKLFPESAQFKQFNEKLKNFAFEDKGCYGDFLSERSNYKC